MQAIKQMINIDASYKYLFMNQIWQYPPYAAPVNCALIIYRIFLNVNYSTITIARYHIQMYYIFDIILAVTMALPFLLYNSQIS